MANDLVRGRQTVAYLVNKSGGGVVAGDVVILGSATASSFITTTSAAQIADWVGVALETIANDASGRVCLFGYVPMVNLASSASLGDYLRTHTVAKQAQRFATTGAGDFGQVLGTGIAPPAIIWARPDQGASGGAALTVQEVDGTPSDTAVTIIRVPNGSLTDNGAGDVSLGTPLHQHFDASDGGNSLNGTQITNGELTTPYITDPTIDLWMDFNEGAAPATPPAGAVRIYPKADGLMYQKDDAGVETALAGGGGGAPDSADYWVETANGSLSAEVVVGTTGITTAAYASRQAAAKAGRLFLPTNSAYVERDTGAAWGSWGPIFPLTPPVDADFAWINQGGASVVTTNGFIHLAAPATSGNSMRIRKKAAPATPYTITARLHALGSINQIYGLCFRQSSDGKLHSFAILGSTSSGIGSQGLFSTKFTDPTTFSANYSTQVTGLMSMFGMPWFLRIADDGSNRICSVSTDGINFFVFHTVGRTDFLTADEVGFFSDSVSASVASGVSLLSWKQA